MVQGKLRSLFREIHLYMGLSLGAIFIMLGLTGSLIAWLPELDALLNPALLRASSAAEPGTRHALASSQLQTVIEMLEDQPSYGRPSQVWLPHSQEGVYIAWYSQPKAKAQSAFEQKISRQVMVDPHTLQIKGERNWGEFGLSRPLLMPTLFHLHHYFLAGEAGKLVLSVSGVLLLVLIILGLVLWWPRLKWKSLKKALGVSHGGSWPRFHYSLHRSAGFYATPVFMVLAVSGIYLNMPNWIVPIVGSVMNVSPKAKVSNETVSATSPLDAARAMDIAQSLYPDARITRIALPTAHTAPFEVRVRQHGDIHEGGGTRVTIDSNSGKVLKIVDPTRAPAGDVFLSWQFPLHSGQAFGSIGKALMSIFGLMPLLFAVTGIYMWLKRKRNTQ